MGENELLLRGLQIEALESFRVLIEKAIGYLKQSTDPYHIGIRSFLIDGGSVEYLAADGIVRRNMLVDRLSLRDNKWDELLKSLLQALYPDEYRCYQDKLNELASNHKKFMFHLLFFKEPVQKTEFKLTANDKRFLRSLKIGAD